MLEFISQLTDPEWIMAHGGLYIVALIVFAETGLFIGFFLPGDTLLFIAGMIVANSLAPFDVAWVNLIFWLTLITISGVLGNYLGYWIGKKFGPLLFEKKDSWLFKRKHLISAKEFYDKRGGAAIVIARFLPIVRTFAPVVAGIVRMDFKQFSFYNLFGCIAWVGSIVTVGFLLGKNIWVKENLETIIIGIVVVTTTPVLIKMLKEKKKPAID